MLFGSHILSLIYDQHRFADFIWFYFSLVDHLSCLCNDIFCILKISYPSQKIEAIGVECFYFDKMGSVTYQFHESLFEFCCGYS